MVGDKSYHASRWLSDKRKSAASWTFLSQAIYACTQKFSSKPSAFNWKIYFNTYVCEFRCLCVRSTVPSKQVVKRVCKRGRKNSKQSYRSRARCRLAPERWPGCTVCPAGLEREPVPQGIPRLWERWSCWWVPAGVRWCTARLRWRISSCTVL